MKKLMFLFALVFFGILCYGQALNGYTQNEVKSMIAPFNKTGTQALQITSVWFDRTIILNMVALLNEEAAANGTTDGIRIYFAYSGNKETVVIVATQDSGNHNPKSPEKDNYHEDYYIHSDTASLFKMVQPIFGEPCYDLACKDVALLYGSSNEKDTCQYTATNAHYLSRSECENMVHAFVAQQTNINTRAEWFDLPLLNAFASLLKNKPFIDGIRIYFARHTSMGDAMYPEYEDEDAFVIVPTQTVPNSNPVIRRQDYFDCYLANYNPTANEKRLKKSKEHFLNEKLLYRPFHFKANTSGGGGQDNGELCPYNCN